jgi:phenylacetate-CoA ligase
MTSCGPPSLVELANFAKERSPYYRELYADLEIDQKTPWHAVPTVQHSKYWTSNKDEDNAVRTSKLIDGILFKTGGTTGNEKYVALSQIELQQTAMQLASGLLAAGARPGDRVANMFYAGELWGSFLLHVLSVMSSPIPLVQIPIGGLGSPETNEHLLRGCKVTAVLSTVTGLVRLADYMLPQGRTLPLIRSVMFGGEAMYPGQRDKLSRILPNATFRGCIYGSMDAGVIGESASDEDTRIYRVLTSTVLLEICTDEEGHEVVEANGIEGFLVASSYIRRLTPAIRYPVGDRGEWVDRDAGLFRVLGRGGIAVRLGPVSLDLADLRSIVLKAMSPISPSAVQAVVYRENGLDVLLCKIMARPGDEEDVATRIVVKLWEERPMLKQHIDIGLIGSVTVRFVDMDDMEVNARTHKLLELVDHRHK